MSSTNYFILIHGGGNFSGGEFSPVAYFRKLINNYHIENNEPFWYEFDVVSERLLAGSFGKGDSYAVFLQAIKSTKWRYGDANVQFLVYNDHDGDCLYKEIKWAETKWDDDIANFFGSSRCTYHMSKEEYNDTYKSYLVD